MIQNRRKWINHLSYLPGKGKATCLPGMLCSLPFCNFDMPPFILMIFLWMVLFWKIHLRLYQWFSFLSSGSLSSKWEERSNLIWEVGSSNLPGSTDNNVLDFWEMLSSVIGFSLTHEWFLHLEKKKGKNEQLLMKRMIRMGTLMCCNVSKFMSLSVKVWLIHVHLEINNWVKPHLWGLVRPCEFVFH